MVLSHSPSSVARTKYFIVWSRQQCRELERKGLERKDEGGIFLTHGREKVGSVSRLEKTARRVTLATVPVPVPATVKYTTTNKEIRPSPEVPCPPAPTSGQEGVPSDSSV